MTKCQLHTYQRVICLENSKEQHQPLKTYENTFHQQHFMIFRTKQIMHVTT